MRRFDYARRALPLLAALTISIAGCSGGGGSSGSALPQAANANTGVPYTNAAAQPSNGTPLNWQILAGYGSHDDALSALAMLPNTITVDEGDSVTWTVGAEDHTITFFGPFNSPQAPPPVPVGGANPSYNGSTYISSGALAPGQQYTVTFTKAGSYPYLCLFHTPEMSGVVVVQPRGTAYPRPQGFYTGTGISQGNQILIDAKDAVRSIPYAPGGTHIAAGVSPPVSNGIPPQATVLRFLDGDRLNLTSVTVNVGTTVTWTNLSANNPHTVTFPIAGQPLPPLPGDPFTPPLGGPTYDGTQITNSGVLNFGDSYSLTFTRAGTFTYECLFHDGSGMIGTVVVK